MSTSCSRDAHGHGLRTVFHKNSEPEMVSPSDQTTTPGESATKQLCSWIYRLSLDDIPAEVKTRAKFLILDGICCALVGAHLPWVDKATDAVFKIEPTGDCPVWGYEKKLGALAAALLNSTEIQSFELDDWHMLAPLHSNAILLPALFAAARQRKSTCAKRINGESFLLATICGYEIGPRVGLCLHGAHMLTRGWHSGATFGHAASGGAVSKLLGLGTDAIEDAFGIACTQSCGLMSAQFGSDVKRMQHGFAARNGLFAALMAGEGYTGIKNVFDEPYGGYLAVFGQGSGKEPPYLIEELTHGLGELWQSNYIRVKSHASMAGTHCTIDTVDALQKQHRERMSDVKRITSIKIEMSEAAYKHGGWKAQRPLTALGAQMNCAYVAAVKLIDGQVTPQEFQSNMLDRDIIWELVDKTECFATEQLGRKYEQRVTISFTGGDTISEIVNAPRDVDPGLSNEEILEKFRRFTSEVIDEERRDRIEELVSGMENIDDITMLEDLLVGPTLNPIG